MRYVLDTNILSEVTRKHPNFEVICWIQDHVEDVFTTSITIKELYYGLFLMPEGKRRRVLKETIDAIVKECSDRTFPYDAFCAYLCAELQASARSIGRSTALEDCMIAAICKRNNATLVTRNVKDFEYFGIDVVNPFEYESPTLAELKRREAGSTS